MGISDYVFWGFITLVALAVLATPVTNLIEDLVNRDGGHARRATAFHDQGRLSGLSYAQRVGELYLNEKMAMFRRLASDAVARHGTDDWLSHIEAAQRVVFESIALENPELLPAFAQQIKGLSYGQVLYPAEARMVDKLWIGHTYRDDYSEDRIASLLRVRPG